MSLLVHIHVLIDLYITDWNPVIGVEVYTAFYNVITKARLLVWYKFRDI